MSLHNPHPIPLLFKVVGFSDYDVGPNLSLSFCFFPPFQSRWFFTEHNQISSQTTLTSLTSPSLSLSLSYTLRQNAIMAKHNLVLFLLSMLVFMFLQLYLAEAAPRLSLVRSLPGFKGTFPSKHYSG